MLEDVLRNMILEKIELEKQLRLLERSIVKTTKDLKNETLSANRALESSFKKFPMLIRFNGGIFLARNKVSLAGYSERNKDGSINYDCAWYTTDKNPALLYCLNVGSNFYIPLELVEKLSDKEINFLKQDKEA